MPQVDLKNTPSTTVIFFVWYAFLPPVLATTNGPHSTGQHVLDTPWHQAIAAAAMVSNRKGVTSAAVLHGAD
jgi:hypothetical protein